MRGPYGFEMTESCKTCKLRGDGFFCQLGEAAVKAFDGLKMSTTYPKDAVLFMQEQAPRGIYVLCEGEVKLSVSSSEGKTLILRIAKPGEALGLMSCISGTAHEVTAETIRPCQISYVRRDDFLRFLAQHPEAYQRVAEQMTSEYRTTYDQLCNIGLSTSVEEKVAKLLLNWSASGKQTKEGTRAQMPLTHEEIGEFIGTSRETVTRTLSEFKSQQLVTIHGSTLLIPNRAALEDLVTV